MNHKPLIFITNDDGVRAKGLQKLIETVRPLGRIVAVAPEEGQSGMSHAITMTRPLYLKKVTEQEGLTIYGCNGTPVDCVKIAFDYLLQNGETPDLVLSGINHGANSAVNVLYSGTMGAAIEGSFYNIPSIGFSLLNVGATSFGGGSGASAKLEPGAAMLEGKRISRSSIEDTQPEIINWLQSIGMLNANP